MIVLVIIRLIRSLTFGTFVAGGRNRKTRLAVMDATAVDSHRRLVLVRRDDIEHLLLIGGPTDVVVEREIRLGQTRRPSRCSAPAKPLSRRRRRRPCHRVRPRPRLSRQRAPEPAQLPPRPPGMARSRRRGRRSVRLSPRVSRNASRTPAHPACPRVVAADRRPPARTRRADAATSVGPGRPNNPSRGPATPYSATPSGHAADHGDRLVAAAARHAPTASTTRLLRELEVTFDAGPPKNRPKPVEMTLDDEMTKLLGELSNHKR